jgi:hypothetical protein
VQILNQILAMLQSVASLLLVPFQQLRSLFTRHLTLTPTVRYVLEGLLVLVVVGGLIVLNVFFDIGRLVDTPRGFESFRNIWLGALFFLVYLAVRLVIFILNQLPSPLEEFPDIDEAFEAGLNALAEANIDLCDTPLFLVVGMTPRSEDSCVQSALIGKEVRVSSRNLPLHWYGDEKGIWLFTPGVSALTQQALYATGAAAPLAAADPGDTSQPTLDPGATLAPNDSGRFQSLGAGAQYQTIVPGGSAAYATLGAAELAPVRSEGYRSPSRRLTLEEKELTEQRIAYFVKRLRDARYPVCPINGAMLVLPYQWTTSPGLSQMADCAKVDMAMLQNSLGTKALCMTMFDGIEESPEFAEYIHRLDKSQVERRCGCGFPALTNLEVGDIDRAHHWIIEYFERQIFDLYQKKLGDPGNGKLFRLLDHLRKSKANFARLLHHAFPDDVPEPFYFGGVYFASLAQVGKVHRPFLDGVLAKLLKEHDDVIGWNDQAMGEDQAYSRLAYTAMFFVVALTIFNTLLFLWIFFLKK